MLDYNAPKKVLFLISRFLDGGIDTVLVEYLSYLATKSNYKLCLAIGINMEELEVYRNRLPSNVNVKYIIGEKWLCRLRKKKIYKRLNCMGKLYDELLLSPIRRILTKYRLTKLSRGFTTVIDFDCCFHSYMGSVTVHKIAFFHFSFKSVMKQSPRRMRRVGRHFIFYDNIVTISQCMLEEGKTMFPNVSGRMIKIYNAKNERNLKIRSEEIPNHPLFNEKFIVVVERLEESQKDIATILKAYKLLHDKNRVIEKLFIIGKGNSEAYLKSISHDLNIESDVVFLGFQPNPLPWIRKSSLLVHSAKFEGLPTVVIEALMLGTPIVATDCPTGPAEILDNGRAGLLVPIGDAVSMAKAILSVLTDAHLKEKLTDEMKRQSKTFSFDQTYTLLDSIIV